MRILKHIIQFVVSSKSLQFKSISNNIFGVSNFGNIPKSQTMAAGCATCGYGGLGHKVAKDSPHYF